LEEGGVGLLLDVYFFSFLMNCTIMGLAQCAGLGFGTAMDGVFWGLHFIGWDGVGLDET
jgi:hypothetical protein